MTGKLLTVTEVAAILRCSRRAVLLAIRRGRLAATCPVGSWLIRQEDLDRLIASSQTVAPVPPETLRQIGLAAARRARHAHGPASRARTSALSGGPDDA